MQITLKDRSNYLRGLLILIGKDKKISEHEKNLLIELSKVLGFSRDFCENAINELLDNDYILEEPPVFSSEDIAKTFILDGIKLAFSDKELHLFEMNWLKSVANANSIDEKWGMNQFTLFKENGKFSEEFEIQKYLN